MFSDDGDGLSAVGAIAYGALAGLGYDGLHVYYIQMMVCFISRQITIKGRQMEMSMNEVILDGKSIHTESDFHKIISDLLKFGPYYGQNLNALWDRLSMDVERPIKITWLNSELSKKCLGEYFDKIIDIFEQTKQQDIRFNWDEKFDYLLK